MEHKKEKMSINNTIVQMNVKLNIIFFIYILHVK